VPLVQVPPDRFVRWVANFASAHGEPALAVREGGLEGVAPDGSTFRATLPFATAYDGAADAAELAGAVHVPRDWGILLVRKGGFAVGRVARGELAEHKIGRRHVQGRTKAGGQSQQRFARRRANQARQAFEAAAEHAARILPHAPLVTGGDRTAVGEVLAQLDRAHRDTVVGPFLALPDPRRRELDLAVGLAQSVQVDVTNA